MTSDTEKRRLGPFELEDKLGVGGMGIVYRANYTKTGQKVAVKVLAPDLTADVKLAKRFEREMDILRKLKHPHIVQYYGGSTSGAQRYYAMELVTGGSLDKVIKKKGKLSWEEAVDYGLQIARALEHAHNAGVIHRDLKPGNLLLSGKGVLKLSDFGIARDTQATQITAAGKTVGTMAYMAPEQITGRHPVSRKTDLYALGCVLFEMLTGRTPFQSETQPELLFKHVEEDPPSAREFNIDVPLWLDQLIAELMEKEPDDRPFDALAVQVKLEEVKQKVAEQESIVRQTVAGGGSAATMKDRDPTLEKALGIRKKKRKRKVDHSAFYERAWFLGLCLLAVVGLIAWGFWPEAEQKIFDRIQPIMASADPDDWPDAKADLEKLLGRYPDGPHADQARRWLDDIEIQRIANYIQTRFGKLGHAPETEAQRLYVEAREYEKFGDRLAALDVYENLEHILAGDDDLEHRAFLVLAKREAERIKATVGDDADRSVFIRNQIAAGDDLYKSGKRLEAREKWRSVVKLYGGKREFEVQVKMAEARIDNPDAALQDVPPAPVP